MALKKKEILIIALLGTLGGIAGYAYYYFIGCKSGTCPITSNWGVSTLFGVAMGVIIGFPAKKKQ